MISSYYISNQIYFIIILFTYLNLILKLNKHYILIIFIIYDNFNQNPTVDIYEYTINYELFRFDLYFILSIIYILYYVYKQVGIFSIFYRRIHFFHVIIIYKFNCHIYVLGDISQKQYIFVQIFVYF